MEKTLKLYDEEGDEVEVTVPGKYEVCPDCMGRGTTYLGWAAKDQPAFTQEDFYEKGPDFQEDYRSGKYNQTCPECDGKRVVMVIDRHACTAADMVHVKAYEEHLRDEAMYQAEIEMERRMGC